MTIITGITQGRFRTVPEGSPNARRLWVNGKLHHVVALPRIPDWPLPGDAPQYLSDSPATELRKGDLCIFRQGDSFQILPRRFGMTDPITIGELLSKSNTTADHVWLVARADETEDA